MSTLTGWAVSTAGGLADHTYVTSDDGRGPWGCFGRSSGGKPICHGTGDGGVADCLSQPSSTAGIVYGVTGVCHQAANRILLPAGVTVSAAKGYAASHFLYGTYGKGFHKWLSTRGVACGLSPGAPVRQPAAEQTERELMERVSALYNEAAAEAGEADDREMEARNNELVAKEVRLMIEHRLGSGFDASKVDELLNLRAEFLKEKQALDEAWLNGAITGEQFANQVNQRLRELLKRIEDVLGPEAHGRLFGELPADFALIDPDIAKTAPKDVDV